ncbi:MAG: 6-bladed beta-propeller [Longimicrobiales bacterium]
MIREGWALLLGAGLGVAVLGLAACGNRGGAAGVLVRDSAGVAIVTNAEPAWAEGEGWRVGAEPTVSIGVLEGDPAYQLYQAWDATRLSDGTIVVANSGTKELRFYDTTGRHVRSVGGEGAGPGEFDGIMFVGVAAGDTIIVWDASTKRISRFSLGGTFLDATTVEFAGLFPQAVGMFGDGSVAVNDGFGTPTTFHEMSSGPVLDSATYVRVEPGSAAVDTLGTFAGNELYVEIGEGTLGISIRPFGERTAFATHGDRYYVGARDEFEIRVYGAASDSLETVIRIPRTPEPVTEEHVARWRERRLANASEDRRAELRREFERIQPVDHFAPYADLIVDSEGAIWGARGAPAADATVTTFDVFDPDGRYLGAVPVPAALSPLEIGPDWILASTRDALDIEHIVVHPLTRTP